MGYSQILIGDCIIAINTLIVKPLIFISNTAPQGYAINTAINAIAYSSQGVLGKVTGLLGM
tara:strand:+ start:144 stop:326 length:183 start_codon:yes stop_codon:yes gene_type:complete